MTTHNYDPYGRLQYIESVPPGTAWITGKHADRWTRSLSTEVSARWVRREDRWKGRAVDWRLVVYAGLLGPTGMPGFMAELNPDPVEAVRAYVIEPANVGAALAVHGYRGKSPEWK